MKKSSEAFLEKKEESGKETTKQGKAHEYALAVVGREPTEDQEKINEYWDAYWDAYYEDLEGETHWGQNDRLENSMNDEIDSYTNEMPQLAPDEQKELLETLNDLVAELRGNPPEEDSDASSEKDKIFFRYQESRDEVFKFSKAIAEYIHSAGIKDLVIADRSSRPLYVGVLEYWRGKFQDTERPGVYFINPKGFKNRESFSEEELKDINERAGNKGDFDESVGRIRSEKEISEEFEKIYPALFKDKNEPILIFDTCIHSGDTLSSVVTAFGKAGFKDVRVGSVNPSDKHSSVKSDFFITKERPEQGCYPFDKDRLIEKTFDHVYSRPSQKRHERAMGYALRREIKEIMQEHLGK
jgi:hypothetical protein